MKLKVKSWTGMIVFFVGSSVLAGQSGYILNGKEVITHIDGKEVAPMPTAESESSKATKSKRNPASTKVNGLIHYDEDSFARCYWLPNTPTLQCIKK